MMQMCMCLHTAETNQWAAQPDRNKGARLAIQRPHRAVLHMFDMPCRLQQGLRL